MKSIAAIIFVAFFAVALAAPKPEADPAILYSSHLPSTVHGFPYSYSYPYYYGGYPSHSIFPVYGYGYSYPGVQTYSAYHNVEGGVGVPLSVNAV